jgi:hypothetical protein
MYMHLLFSIVKRDFPSLIGFAFLLARMRTAGKTVARKISFLVHDAGNVEQNTRGFWASCRQSGSWDGTIAKFRVRCDPGRTRDGVRQFAYGCLKFLHIS